MDTEKLIRTVTDALQLGVTQRSGPESYSLNEDFQALWDSTHVWMAPGVKEHVAAALRQQPEMSAFDPGWVSHGKQSGSRVEINAVAEWLLAQALSRGPERAVLNLAKFIQQNKATVVTACAVAGVSVDTTVSLAGGLKLIPFDSLPASHGRGFVRQQYATAIGVVALPPMAILVFHDDITPVVRKFDSQASSPPLDPQADNRIIATRHEIFADTVRCLTLVGPCSPLTVGFWQQLITEGVPILGGGAYGHSAEFAAATPVSLGEFNVADAQALTSAFLSLPPYLRDELRIPLDRLNQAIRERRLVDQAIDLGIALEALLLHGLPDDRGELRYRLSLSGAFLVGKDSDERKNIFRFLRELYDLRSGAVHSGRIKIEQVTSEKLREGLRLCARLIRRVIELGKWPNWSDLIIGQ